jgi:hypothetical protein
MRKLIYRLCNALLPLFATNMLQYKVSTSSVVAQATVLLIAFDKLNGLPLFATLYCSSVSFLSDIHWRCCE